MAMFKNIFGGKSNRQAQLDEQEAAAMGSSIRGANKMPKKPKKKKGTGCVVDGVERPSYWC